MTPTELAAAVGVAGAAVVVVWPAPSRRLRRLRVLNVSVAGRRPQRTRLSLSHHPPVRAVSAAAVLAACLGALAGGPVAAVIGSVYGGLAGWMLLRRRTATAVARARARQLDHLGALAADLRAGLPAPPIDALPDLAGSGAGPGRRVLTLARAAWRLAEQTGAPLAELIERIEADARAMDRAVSSAAAQAAGARATAWLLAGLPVGGIALGYGIGVDALDVLLHTPIGAGCAIAAAALQLAGLAWAERLSGSWLREL